MGDDNIRVAYILNHYPKVSHSFIRREIRELERRGLEILRISIRGWDTPVFDPEDIAEQKKTAFVLKVGFFRIFLRSLQQFVTRPAKFGSATVLALQMMRGSDRPAIWHLFYLAEACWIAAYVRKRGAMHLHAHFGTNPAEVAALVAILAGVSYSFTVHGFEEFDKVQSLHLAKKVDRSAFTVAISSFCRSQLYRITNYKEWNKIHVVHCGIDENFAEITQVAHSRSKRLVCVGRLCAEKGQLLLVEAMAELAKERPDCELVLVGDGDFRAPIEALIAANGLSKSVRITGWATADQVKHEMLEARAVILPSFIEGLPVVLMEAMVLGKPTLATYVGAIPELVIDGTTGWLFPSGSKADMMAAIRQCLDTPAEKLEAMGCAARTRALERHSLSRQAELLLSLFEGLRKGSRLTVAAEQPDLRPT